MEASIVTYPTTFDRVDRVKEVVGEEILPGDDRLWILGQQLVFDVDAELMRIPAGCVTDGASVPRFAQRLTGWEPWEDPQRWAGIVHDWLYCQPGISRRYADRVFLHILESEGGGPIRRWVMYLAVRVGGWPAYHQDQISGVRVYA